jgi:nucleotide-binding universal stress UspA family protein
VIGAAVRHMFVPLDGSVFSEMALPSAARLAGKLEADVCLFSAVDTVDEEPKRREALEAISLPGVRTECEVVVDRDPAGAIHEALRRVSGSIACMATHARSRTPAVARSVFSDLLVRAHDPVIAVGPRIGTFAARVEHEPRRGVVVGVDDNADAPHLVETAAAWSAQLDEPLTVLTVAEPVPEPLVAGPVRRSYGPDGNVDQFLRVLLARLPDDVEVEPRALYDPLGPAPGIVDWVREHPALVVVIGTAAPVGLERLARGSRAAAIVRGCAAPVLVIPTRVRRSGPPRSPLVAGRTRRRSSTR